MNRANILLAILLCAGACGETGEGSWEKPADAAGDAAAQEPCGGHGSLHGDHCHCEDGWAPVHDSCVSIESLPACTAESPEGSSCRCEPADKECACPDHSTGEVHVGAYYCAEELH